MAKSTKGPARKTATKKTTTAGKPSAKKTTTKKTTTKKATTRAVTVQSPARAKQIAELTAIAGGLDDAALELLLAQAQLLDHKGKIEKFNRQLNLAAVKAVEARKAAARPAFDVTVERTKDDFFIIQMDQARIFFNRGELREITRICHAAANEAGGARRLYAWFARERSDLLADVGINTERSPYLANLYHVIISTYTVKK